MTKRVRRLMVLLGVGVLALLTVAGVPAAATSAPARVVVPLDERPHRQPTEWWYFSGHLYGTDAAGHRHVYGFEDVIFQFLGDGPAPVYIADVAVTDITRGQFAYGAQVDSYPVPRTPGSFALHTGDWTMSGSDGNDALHASLADYDLSVQLRTTKPAAIHGAGGVIPYGPFGTSKYYSWTSLDARGTVIDHGVPVSVTGIAWMDHQWGPIDFSSGGGWDWFSMQLAGNVQYMLYFVRDPDGQIVDTIGSKIDADGTVTPLSPITEQALDTWTSPVTGITYGSSWRVTVPGGSFTVTPKLIDQELDLREFQGVAYWEGAVSVRGRIDGHHVAGVGYTEINPPNAP